MQEELNIFSEQCRAWGFEPGKCHIQPHGSGNINRTFRLDIQNGSSFILQELNTAVFRNPEHIIHNWQLANEHFRHYHPAYPFLQYLPTSDGTFIYYDMNRKPWRLMPLISESICHEITTSADQAAVVAKAFADFTQKLKGVEVERFKTILPDFHNLAKRQDQFNVAVESASVRRHAESESLIDQLNTHRWITDSYNEIIQLLPQRIVHMDAKISNILFKEQSGEVAAVIDLDTMAPATILSDLGDMIRSMSCEAGENETDFSKITVRSDFLNKIINSYLENIPDLNQHEKDYAVFGGIMLVYMQAIRFLADYLQEDVYYKIQYPSHNLVRAGNQLTLLKKLLKEPVYRRFNQS